MNGMKYITFEGPYHQEIVVFASSREHRAMAHALDIQEQDVLGAGFVSVDGDGALYCYGDSTGLRVMSRGEKDTILLNRMLK